MQVFFFLSFIKKKKESNQTYIHVGKNTSFGDP